MNKKRGLTKRGWFITILLSVIISVGFIAANTDRRNFEIVKNLDIFYTLFRELNSFYVDEINPDDLIKTSIDGMLESLDPYTTFIPESEMDDFRFMTTGEYAGIGALITRRGNFVVVSEPYEGFPAQEAGLRAGDRILKIDGDDMKGKQTSDVSDRLKGPAGTEVIVLVERPGKSSPITITITRRSIQINPVPYYGMLDDKTGIIILNNFTQNCSQEVEKALKELKKNENMSRLILDLRGNPGGLMDEAVKIANLFLPRGSEVVSTKGRVSQWDKTYRAPRQPIDTVMPLAVLINRGSASASEIVAGALQDHDRALVIGQRSFGKGLVQTTRSLAYNSSLKVTTARYYIPSGRSIQAVDYANRNEDGSVGFIPDSLMREFSTSGGRTVFDGGGISPDVIVERDRFSSISMALIGQQTVFDYATLFAVKTPSIEKPGVFQISDDIYADFISYVTGLEDFRYESQSQNQFRKLKETAEREGYFDVNKELFSAMEENLRPDVARDLGTFREEVEEFLAMELLRRFYYQRGAIIHNLKTDNEVAKAREILSNPAKYNDMLNGTILTHAGDKRGARN
ncbi:S41 family peptidase [Alkalitalea saponilacus]|uniref:Carboxyl-terminal processing protease n=1 Tax=Alkalitalea saponilacus TaxID=889453 RepID=A0A1T5E7E9_9BACT|nr:S41 family peptidase [Alkalitalea saponilacus]ASB49087.1 peptidase S41 [Alkalitalea saponilacus]SKB79887.1 carboxyl-terminal processing protease [Alkalitalea saponilacus]